MSDFISIDLIINENQAEVVLNKTKQKLGDFVQDVQKAQPEIKFKIDGKPFIDLEKLEAKANETRQRFGQIADVRLNSGQFGLLTKDIVAAHERSQQLERDIKSIRAELQNPNRKSSIKFLTDELQAAEREAEKLNRKLNTLPNAPNAPTSPRSRASGGGRSNGRGGITNNQATFLELTDDFAPEGFNRAYNAAGRAVFAAQNIKETAKDVKDMAKDMSLFSGLSITSLATFAAIAAAGYLIVDATQKIRAEAEKNLKIQDDLTKAGNRQIRNQERALQNLAEMQQLAAESRNFSQYLENSTIDALEAKKNRLQEIINLTPQQYPNEKGELVDNTRFKVLSDELNQINGQVVSLKQRNKLEADTSFSNRWEIWKKNQDDAIKAEQRRYDTQRKINDEIKKSVEITNDLTTKLNKDNPFVSLAVEGETAIRKLKDTITDPVLLQTALKLQEALNSKQFNALSYDSNKKALTFEQDAFRTSRIRDNQFSSFQRALDTVEKKIEFTVKMFELDRQINEADFYSNKYNPNNPKSFDESRFSPAQLERFGGSAGIRANDAFTEISKLKNFSLDGTGIFGQGAIADKVLERLPSREDLLRLLSSPYAGVRGQAQFLLNEQGNALRTKKELEAQRLRDFLYDQETAGLNKKFAYDQIGLLNNQKGLSKSEYANRFLDITKGLGNDIDPYLRRGMFQQGLTAASEERKKQDETQKYIKNISDKLDKIVSANGLKVDSKDGGTPTKSIVEIRNGSDKANVLGASPVPSDMDQTYNLGFFGGSNR